MICTSARLISCHVFTIEIAIHEKVHVVACRDFPLFFTTKQPEPTPPAPHAESHPQRLFLKFCLEFANPRSERLLSSRKRWFRLGGCSASPSVHALARSLQVIEQPNKQACVDHSTRSARAPCLFLVEGTISSSCGSASPGGCCLRAESVRGHS